MGRAKLKMELIQKEKSRKATFKKRKEGLIKKMHEFTTLCDARACMIIYVPKQENSPAVEPEIWPQNIDEVHKIIDVYKSKKDSGNRSFGLRDFFHDRKRKIEDELTRFRKRNLEIKYPPPKERDLRQMSEGKLREFASILGHKADLVRSRIKMLRRSSGKLGHVKDQLYPHPPLHVYDMHVPFPNYYPTSSIEPNSMMMLLMNSEDRFGGASSSNGGANISFKQQIFYERTMPYVPSLPLLPPPPPPCMMAPPLLPFTTGWENQEVAHEDALQYQMKNMRG